ncbi:ogr/Delta-like zinc finger family protein [Acinetobacter bereziniae]|uniref:ogr/Delta-like zinc finger family protein n=1 Tax=Acinetobacter bereziniae TaxID=106648 RepID=UPI0039C432DB
MICPHCEANTLMIRSSKQQHPLFKVIYFQCRDVLCGFTCQAHLEIKYQISPPALENPEISLPSVKIIKPKRNHHDFKKNI